MDVKWRAALAVLGLPALLAASAARAADSGVYLGIAAGQASVQGAGPSGTVDANSYRGYEYYDVPSVDHAQMYMVNLLLRF